MEKKSFKEIIMENKAKVIGGILIGTAAVVGLVLGAKALSEANKEDSCEMNFENQDDVVEIGYEEVVDQPSEEG